MNSPTVTIAPVQQHRSRQQHHRSNHRSRLGQSEYYSPMPLFPRTSQNTPPPSLSAGSSSANIWGIPDGSVRASVREQWTSFIEKANQDRHSCLVLFGLKLDPMAINYFLEQWIAIRGKTSIKLEKIILSGYCSFLDENSANLMIGFMEEIGEDLKELVVSDHLDFISPFLFGLRRLKHLERLCLTRMHLRGTALQEILENTKISELALAQFTFEDDAMYQGFLLGLKKRSFGLRSLELCMCLSDDQVSALADSILNSSSRDTLTILDLSWNSITWLSFLTLAQILDQCSHLEELDVRMCRGMFQGLKHDNKHYKVFTEALEKNSVLRSMDLSGCRITKNQAVPLFQALENNDTLQRLDVWSLHEVSEALAQSLPKIRKLERLRARLDFQHPALRKALLENPSLVCIDPVRGQVEVDEAVSQMLSRNKMLQKTHKYLQNRNTFHTTTSWVFCAEQLMKDCRDMSPLYAFLLSSSEFIKQRNRNSNKRSLYLDGHHQTE